MLDSLLLNVLKRGDCHLRLGVLANSLDDVLSIEQLTIYNLCQPPLVRAPVGWRLVRVLRLISLSSIGHLKVILSGMKLADLRFVLLSQFEAAVPLLLIAIDQVGEAHIAKGFVVGRRNGEVHFAVLVFFVSRLGNLQFNVLRFIILMNVLGTHNVLFVVRVSHVLAPKRRRQNLDARQHRLGTDRDVPLHMRVLRWRDLGSTASFGHSFHVCNLLSDEIAY